MAYERITRWTDTEKARISLSPFKSRSPLEHGDQNVSRNFGEQIPAPLANLLVSVLRKYAKCELAARNHTTNLVSTECKVSIGHYGSGVSILWYKF